MGDMCHAMLRRVMAGKQACCKAISCPRQWHWHCVQTGVQLTCCALLFARSPATSSPPFASRSAVMHSNAQMAKMFGVLYTLAQSAWVCHDRMLGVCTNKGQGTVCSQRSLSVEYCSALTKLRRFLFPQCAESCCALLGGVINALHMSLQRGGTKLSDYHRLKR